MRDDRPAVPSFAGRVFSSTLSFVTRPSGRPGRYLPAVTRLAGARHRQKRVGQRRRAGAFRKERTGISAQPCRGAEP